MIVTRLCVYRIAVIPLASGCPSAFGLAWRVLAPPLLPRVSRTALNSVLIAVEQMKKRKNAHRDRPLKETDP